jgi:glycosyltransferase involved in cell wall biosynthesis
MPAPDRTMTAGVVVPVYNRLHLLEETVASLKAQTLPDAEFILVDDRSDEGVQAFLASVIAADARFRVVRKPDGIERGSQSSRNIGLDSLTADAVVFLDSDDLLEPECLEQRLKFLRDNEHADIIVGHQAVLSDAGLKWLNIQSTANHLDRFLNCAGRIDVPWVNGGVMLRVDRLRALAVRWRPEFYWDDLVFHIECLSKGMTVVPMPAQPRPDSYYRAHNAERFGNLLASAEGIANAAEMFAWIATRLIETGFASESRINSLKRSFFHFCVRQPLELDRRGLASRLIDSARSQGLITAGEATRMSIYAAAFRLRAVSSRVSARLVGVTEAALLADFFEAKPSTFSVLPVS